jgi:hypothetical protein
MTTCITCGAAIEPGWNACRLCGRAVEFKDLPASPGSTPPESEPQVELISRDWNVVEVDADELIPEALEINDAPPLAPGSIEVSVDGVSVIAADEDEADDSEPVEDETGAASAVAPSDSWAHLRPHGEMPPLVRRVSVAARVVQALAAVTAIVAVGSGAIHFYLNTQLDALSRGETSSATVSNLLDAADVSLLVVGGMVLLTLLVFTLWRWRVRRSGVSSGKAGAVAVLSVVAGTAVVATFHTLRRDTITEGIAANSLIVLGLGLIIAAALIIVPTVGRLDQKVHL